MASFGLKGGSALLATLSAVSLSFCVSVSKTQQYGIEVKRGTTVEEKLQIAKSIVTDERFSRLKAQIRERMPGISDAQLAGMGLRWNQTQFRPLSGGEPRTSVIVLVVIQEQAGIDGKAIVETAAAILDPEINGTNGARSTGS
jgi:hypothetical protein